MTAKLRALSADIAQYCDSGETLDWADDLARIGVTIPEGENEREAFAKSLGSAFGAVASTDGAKRGATVKFIAGSREGENGKPVATLEVAVTFRNVKSRA
jgi:hypothetical protein